MAKLFLVFGTQGAGKTALLSGISSAKAVNVGDRMLKLYAKKFGISNRDQIREQSLSNYEYMISSRNEVLKEAGAMPGTIAIDTHPAIKKGDAYETGLSFKDLDLLKGKAKAIIYIDANSAQIMSRRKKEMATRKREDDTKETIDMHRNINLTFVSIFALYLEVPIYIVENADGKLEAARKRVEEIINSAK